MTDTQPQASRATAMPLTQRLKMIFGTNVSIRAILAEDGAITFYDEERTKNQWETTLPESVEFFGPGNYIIKIDEQGFDFTLEE